jgi:hypothetical protein
MLGVGLCLEQPRARLLRVARLPLAIDKALLLVLRAQEHKVVYDLISVEGQEGRSHIHNHLVVDEAPSPRQCLVVGDYLTLAGSLH